MGDVQKSDESSRLLPLLSQGYENPEQYELSKSPLIGKDPNTVAMAQKALDIGSNISGGVKSVEEALAANRASRLDLQKNGPKFLDAWQNKINDLASKNQTISSPELLKGQTIPEFRGREGLKIVDVFQNPRMMGQPVPTTDVRLQDSMGQGFNVGLDELMHESHPDFSVDKNMSDKLNQLNSLPHGSEDRINLSNDMLEDLSSHNESGKKHILVKDPNSNRIMKMSTEDGTIEPLNPKKYNQGGTVKGYADGTDSDGVQPDPSRINPELLNQLDEVSQIPGGESVDFANAESVSPNMGPYRNEKGELDTGKEEKDAEDKAILESAEFKALKPEEQTAYLKQMGMLDSDDSKPSESVASAGPSAPSDKVQEEISTPEGEQAVVEHNLDGSKEPSDASDEKAEIQDVNNQTPSGDKLIPEAMNPDLQNAISHQNSGLMEKLQQAIDQKNRLSAQNRISAASGLIAAGLAGHGAEPNLQALKMSEANENAPLQDLETKVKMSGFDPQSPASMALRQYLQQKGFKVPDTASANDLQTMLPYLKNDQAAQLAMQKAQAQIKSREDIAQKNRDAAAQRVKDLVAGRIAASKAGQESKIGKESRDAEVKAETDMNSTRGKQALMMAQRNLMAVKNAQKMLEEFPDTDKWTPQQVTLFNSEIAKIATGGVPTESQIHELSNPTAASGMANIVQRLTNVPTGADQSKFINLNKQYLEGLGGVAQQTIRDNIGNVAKSYQDKLGPEAYKKLLYRHSDMLGLFTPQQERGIQAVMQAKGMSRQDAIKALVDQNVLKDVNY